MPVQEMLRGFGSELFTAALKLIRFCGCLFGPDKFNTAPKLVKYIGKDIGCFGPDKSNAAPKPLLLTLCIGIRFEPVKF